VLIFHEPMPPARLAAFALVWLALAVFTWDGLRQRRVRLAGAATAAESAVAQRAHQHPRQDGEHQRTEADDRGLARRVGTPG
jgi:hypothetical protein